MKGKMHEFGLLLTKFHMRIGWTQTKLAEEAAVDLRTVNRMCYGKRLSGPQLRFRIISLIEALQANDENFACDEANSLLLAAGLDPLNRDDPSEAKILEGFYQTGSDDMGELSPSDITPSITIN